MVTVLFLKLIKLVVFFFKSCELSFLCSIFNKYHSRLGNNTEKAEKGNIMFDCLT